MEQSTRTGHEHKKYCCRRLLRQDIPQLCSVQNDFFADNAKMSCSDLQNRFDTGEVYGVLYNEEIITSFCILKITDKVSPCSEIRSIESKIPKSDDIAVICDIVFAKSMPCGSSEALGVLLDFADTVSVLIADNSKTILCMPVKTADGIYAPFYSDFVLYLVSLLHNLAPNYIFYRGEGEFDIMDNRAAISISDTFEVSRSLENGWYGIAVAQRGKLLLVK